jgi:hypothetical protein
VSIIESTVKDVKDSPATKVIPESAVIDSAKQTASSAAETVLMDSSFDGYGCNKCDRIENEFKVLKGSIKKLIVDIREQMSANENPFLNIQQMMPTQTPVISDSPLETDSIDADEDKAVKDSDAESAVAEKKGRNKAKSETDDDEANDRCPLLTRRSSTDRGEIDAWMVLELLYEILDRREAGTCYECSMGPRQRRSLISPFRSGCPAESRGTLPCGMLNGPRGSVRYPSQACPMSQHAASRPEPAVRCPMERRSGYEYYQDEPQMYRPTPYYHDDYSCTGSCSNYPPEYYPEYATREWHGPAGHYPEYNGRYDRDPRSENGRPGPRHQPRRGYRPIARMPEYYEVAPAYDSMEPEQGYREHSRGNGRWKSLLVRDPDDGYVQPESEPVVINIPGMKSDNNSRRKPESMNMTDAVLVDVEPENVVPRSARASRRKGL